MMTYLSYYYCFRNMFVMVFPISPHFVNFNNNHDCLYNSLIRCILSWQQLFYFLLSDIKKGLKSHCAVNLYCVTDMLMFLCFLSRFEGFKGVHRILSGPAKRGPPLCCTRYRGQYGRERSSCVLLWIPELHQVLKRVHRSPDLLPNVTAGCCVLT